MFWDVFLSGSCGGASQDDKRLRLLKNVILNEVKDLQTAQNLRFFAALRMTNSLIRHAPIPAVLLRFQATPHDVFVRIVRWFHFSTAR